MSRDNVMWRIRKNFFSVLCRKKKIQVDDNQSTPLKKCLNIFDLTFLSIGAIIGSGIFVFAGSSIRYKAGPGIVLSFVVAGVPSVIAALCFAEFGARVPKAGSTYDFIYVTLGEFWAALVGWYIITGPVFTGATISRSWAAYFDTMIDGWIANRTKESIGTFDSPYLAPYPDFFAACLVLLISAVVASGAKCSARFNNAFGVIKLVVIVFIICYGLSFADGRHWTDAKSGGFLPFGFSGVMAAAPTAFFAYSGFELACTAGEEAKNPRRDVVWAIVISTVWSRLVDELLSCLVLAMISKERKTFFVSAVAYILMCTTITLMIPYDEVAPTSSFADAFEQRGAPWAKYVVAIGALSGLTNVLFGSIFPVPRYIYAVASDGLIFRWLSVVNQRTQVPVRAIALYAVITIVVMLLFDLDALVEFLSMGGLLCYTLVSASVIILRYQPRLEHATYRAGCLKDKYAGTFLDSLFGRFPPGTVVLASVTAEVFLMAACSAALVYAPWNKSSSALFCVLMIIVSVLGIILIAQQLLVSTFVQNNDEHLWFKVPLVPLLPSISMFIDILMMLYLKPLTWLRFGLYLLIGLVVYALYGIRHSIHRTSVHPTPQRLSPREMRSTKM